MSGKAIGWEVVGPKRKGADGGKERLVWQPNEDAIRVSYKRLISEGWDEETLEIRQVFFKEKTEDSD